MNSPVLFASHNLQVARAIIELISVTMMHYFIGTQRSTNCLTCDITMNSHVTVVTCFRTTRLIFLLIAFFINIRLMFSKHIDTSFLLFFYDLFFSAAN